GLHFLRPGSARRELRHLQRSLADPALPRAWAALSVPWLLDRREQEDGLQGDLPPDRRVGAGGVEKVVGGHRDRAYPLLRCAQAVPEATPTRVPLVFNRIVDRGSTPQVGRQGVANDVCYMFLCGSRIHKHGVRSAGEAAVGSTCRKRLCVLRGWPRCTDLAASACVRCRRRRKSGVESRGAVRRSKP